MILSSTNLAVLTMTLSTLAMASLGHAADPFGNGTIKTPTTASGGTGTAANVQTDDDVNYTVAKGATASISGFGTHGGAITSVYLFVQYSVETGYTGTNAVQVNGVNTTIVPALRDYGRWAYVDITGGSFSVDTSAEISALAVTFNNNDGGTSNAVLLDCVYVVVNPQTAIPIPPTWSEDFNGTGQANPMVWNYEVGYRRNNEDQYYVAGASNGWQEGGNFIIEGRKESVGGFQYTSASIVTNNKYYWKFGRAQIRAKIPAKPGMWPAIWGTGEVGQWPHCGEVDIMEYYGEKILANVAVGTANEWTAKWDGGNRTLTSLLDVDSNWRNEWHIWTMQWDEKNGQNGQDEGYIRIYVDNILVNTISQSFMVNTAGYNTSWGPQYPFKSNGMTCWLNLAIGGNSGGDPTATMNSGPQRYLIDYWKVWEGATNNVAPTDIALSGSAVTEGLAAGTVVGMLSATDADPAEVLRYTLVAGEGSTHNAQFSIPEFISGNTLQGVLKTAAVLNDADGATRSIRVRVTDIEGATYEKAMTVNVAPSGYLVTYDGNTSTGGSVPVDSNLYPPGSSVTVLGNTGNLERTGETFVGWNTAATGSGTTYFAGNPLTISSNVTLYAVWTSFPTYTVSYDANGASGTAPSDQTKVQDTSLTLSTNYGNLAKTGYAFAGWNTANSGLGTDYAAGGTYSADAAVTLYAKWAPTGVLAVTPAGNLTSTGIYGGSFSPSSLEYTLTNSGTAPLDWAATKTAAWLSLSSPGGTLPVGDSITVTVSITGADSLNVGAYSDTVSFTNTINGNGNTTRLGSLTIGKAPQAITFGPLTTVLDNAPSFSLDASASSGLAVSYISSNTNVATIINGSTVNIVGPGSTTITASQAGNNNYNAALAVPQALTVGRANPLAVINGPYLVLSDQSLSLNGVGSQPSAGATIDSSSYSWELDNEIDFDDATGVTPASITFADLINIWGMEDGPNTISLRVVDSAGKTSIVSTTVEVVVSPTWDSNGTNENQTDGIGDWTAAGQWWNGTTNVTWASGDDAIFGNGGTGSAVTLASPTTAGSLTFNSFTGTYTLGTSGQTITLNGGISKSAASGAVTIVSPVTLGAAQNWTNDSAGLLTVGPDAVSNGGFLLSVGGTGNTTVSGAIGGAGGLAKSGVGTLSLSGSSGYGGTTTVSGGTLVLSNANTISSATSVGATGTLQLGHATSMGSSTMTLASGATLQLRNDANTAFTAPIATPAGAVTYNFDVNNAGSAVTGSTLSLGNLTFANNTTNQINVTGGNGYILSLGTITNSISSATLNTFTFNATAAPLTFGSYAGGSWTQDLIFKGGNNITARGNISASSNGSIKLTIIEGTTVTLNGQATLPGTGTAATTLTSGTLNVNHLAALGNVSGKSSLSIGNGTTLNNTSGAAITSQTGNPTITIGGNFAFGTVSSTSASNLNLGTGAVTNNGNRTITLNATGTTLTLGGVMTNTSGTNQTTTVNGAGNTLSLGGYNLSNSTTSRTGIFNGDGNVIITGVVANSSNGTPASNLTYNGAGALTLGGQNTYTGNTTVSSGTLAINSTGGVYTVAYTATPVVRVSTGATLQLATWAYGANGGLENLDVGAARLLVNGGTITYTGNGEGAGNQNNGRLFTIGKDTGTIGGATLNAAGTDTWYIEPYAAYDLTAGQVIPTELTLTLTGASNGRYAKRISGPGSLAKSGSGTWTLTGANTYTGATTVTGGTLRVNSPGSLHASSAVTVGTGTGGTLGGNGTINGNVTVAADGSLAPGGASAGTLTIGSLNISALANGGTGKLNFELDPLANASDRIAVTGTLTIGVGALGFNDFVFTDTVPGGLQVTGTTPYTLISSGGITAGNTLDPDNLSGTLPGGLIGTLQINGSNIELAVTSEVTKNYQSWAASQVPPVTGGENGDDDNDGVKNLVEYALVDGGERGVLDGNTITFTKRGGDYGSDLTYDIESSTLLTAESWTTLAKPPVVENAGSISYTFTPGSPVMNFARLKVVKAP